jgi:hypothetical protein
MMDSDGGADGPRKRRRFSPPDEEPYVLQQLVADVPVAREDTDQAAYITCVESWGTRWKLYFPLDEALLTLMVVYR